MKRKGYLFIEIIVIMGVFSVIIFPLVMLMDKNINKINFIREEYEVKKVVDNLEKVFIKILQDDKNKNLEYRLTREKDENFLLSDSLGKNITRLRGIRLNSEVKIFIEKKKVFIEEDKIKKEFLSIVILKVKIKDKIIKKVLII
ncbi:hypothetical protein [Fusobacterium sp.]|uniref:hypothetical protein n=1 Tax=Fusobacterium sp. TaxID=68766 RepID=UPI00260E977C|nr:hypothetical protein [Fusobacterium sp.]